MNGALGVGTTTTRQGRWRHLLTPHRVFPYPSSISRVTTWHPRGLLRRVTVAWSQPVAMARKWAKKVDATPLLPSLSFSMWSSPFVLLVYASGYLFMLFNAVCLAAGLVYLANLAEEYVSVTKQILKGSLLAVLLVHVALLCFEDQIAWTPLFVGIAAHVVYALSLPKFPFLELTAAPSIAAVGLFLLNNYLWITWFVSETLQPLLHVLGFCLITVWLVPFIFLISISSDEFMLPGVSAGGTYKDGNARKRRTTLLKIYDFFADRISAFRQSRAQASARQDRSL